MLLTLAAQLAYGRKAKYIALGIIGSSRSFFDCTTQAIRDIDRLLNHVIFGNGTSLRILTPVGKYTKRDLIVLYHKHSLPIEITYSCQKNDGPCGMCPSCKEVQDAIQWYET